MSSNSSIGVMNSGIKYIRCAQSVPSMSFVSLASDFNSNIHISSEMRILFRTIRKLVEQRYRPDPMSTDSPNYLPWQSVSAFCFLRFIVPAILHPHLFGLVQGLDQYIFF